MAAHVDARLRTVVRINDIQQAARAAVTKRVTDAEAVRVVDPFHHKRNRRAELGVLAAWHLAAVERRANAVEHGHKPDIGLTLARVGNDGSLVIIQRNDSRLEERRRHDAHFRRHVFCLAAGLLRGGGCTFGNNRSGPRFCRFHLQSFIYGRERRLAPATRRIWSFFRRRP